MADSLLLKDYGDEDSNFIAADSPYVIDFEALVGGRNPYITDGYIIVDGAGDLIFEISSDGATYNATHTLKQFEKLSLENRIIRKLRLTHSGTDTAYRVYGTGKE